MNYTELADLLFPDITTSPEEMEERFPKRNLPEGAAVTRFAPSPTGFVHFGGLFPSTVGERLAHLSGGVFYLRIEDTDAKREIPGAAQGLIKTLSRYGINFDEGAVLDSDSKISSLGNYGPYKQSERGEIYRTFAKSLVAKGLAYPVFTTEEELEELLETDKKAQLKNTDWTQATLERKSIQQSARNFTLEEVRENLEKNNPFVLRILSDGDGEKKIKVTDLIKGTLEIPENDEDFVLLKSDGIPTYHFAHAVDDHLMGTTHVIRGEEWLPSLSKHIQLFRYLGWREPKYMHISQIMRLDENGNKKKLSKRDMGANMDDYTKMGYIPEAVCEYVMTLLNSNYEEWHAQNPEKNYKEFPFSIKKMSSSGCLFDFNKLNDVSKNVISRLSAEEVTHKVTQWALDFDEPFGRVLAENPEYAKKIFAIGRGTKKPRRDLATLADARPYMSFFYDEFFKIEDGYPENFDTEDIKKTLLSFNLTYDEKDDMNTWFEKVKLIAEGLGYASDMKAYKANPQDYKGSVADISMFIRVAVTGKMNAPDLYTVMQILGRDRTVTRINNMINSL